MRPIYSATPRAQPCSLILAIIVEMTRESVNTACSEIIKFFVAIKSTIHANRIDVHMHQTAFEKIACSRV